MDIIDSITLRFAAAPLAERARRDGDLPPSDAVAFVGGARTSFALASAPWGTSAAGFMSLPSGDAAASLRAVREFLARETVAKLYAEMRTAKKENPLGYIAALNAGGDSPARQFCSGLVGDLTDHLARDSAGEAKSHVAATIVVVCSDVASMLAFALVCLGRLDGAGATSPGVILDAIGRALGEGSRSLGWLTVTRHAARVAEGKVVGAETVFEAP